MLAEMTTVRARFTMRLRCHCCLEITSRELYSPDLEDAPGDIEELLASAWLGRQNFSCGKCENPIATLVSLRQDETEEN